MFRCEDKVVYGNYGVCTVTKTDEMMSLGGIERPYYVLVPLCKRGGTVYVPTDHEDLMSPIMSRDEALDVLSRVESIEPDHFCDNNSRTVDEHFKHMLRSNSCEAAICVAKSMHVRIKEQAQKKRLPSSMYTRLLDQAQRQLRSELSAALEWTEEELVIALEERGLKA